MIWHIDYTETAKQDLRDILDYISNILLEPVTAAKQVNRIMDAVDSLVNMPMRHRLYDSDPWRTRGLHIMPVDNYTVLYFPDEIKNRLLALLKFSFQPCAVKRFASCILLRKTLRSLSKLRRLR